jgi:hypothetical protein
MIELLVGPISALLSRIIPDKSERDRLAYEIATMAEKQAHEQVMAQIEVNKTEAAHNSLYVAGWRPFIGWSCGIAMAFNYIGIPLIETVCVLYGTPLAIDPLDLEVMMPVLLGMLGLGGMRTYEKRNGVAREK